MSDAYNKKIVLIDGHSILNRAFYGVPDLSNAGGLHTNAIYGFLNILFKILEEEKPDYLIVAFDVKAPTFRHELYDAYKGTRKPMPEELREQVPVMKEVLKAMDILTMEQAGLEADDILGTIAKQSEQLGLEVSLVSGDRDLLQIASEHIKIRIPKTKGGKTVVEDYYAADVSARYGVTPEQFIELKALMGDTADNIPGVPKVGEKTATELMVTYGSIEGIYEHIEETSKKSIKATLLENRKLADLSKALAAIKTDAGLDYELEDARLTEIYTKKAYTLFCDLEFKNLLKRFEKDNQPVHPQKVNFKLITEITEVEEVFLQASKQPVLAFSIIQDGKSEEEFVALSVAFSEKDIYIIKAGGFLRKAYLVGKLQELLHVYSSKENRILTGFYLKQDYDVLLPQDTGALFDTQLAAYLLNPLKNDYQIEDIAGEYLNLVLEGRGERFGKASLASVSEEQPDQFLEYAGYCAYTSWKAVPILRERLKESGMLSLFHEIEMPVTLVLFDMEQEGIRVKQDELQVYGEALVERISELEAAIHEKAGTDFNINSPKQLGEVLFEKMQIPGGKKTKTGYSTGAEVLEKLAAEYPIASEILEYRGLAKLKSTYADGLAVYIDKSGRIHSTFNQTITATGRISSTEPNLQNIPMRMELGRLIRKVFVPKPGFLFTDADYSQIELRILAHMSGDEQLIDAYKMEQDIHRITASQVFHTPFEEVTDLQRRNAKAVNFGIVYGISSFGLSQDLSISRKEAAGYIEQYFATYPDVKRFLDHAVEQAKNEGYVTTMYGRRRPIPELKSSNFMQRSFGERVAMNSPIQGTAADIIKIAMIRVWKELKSAGLKSRLILQIHDELLIETCLEESAQVKKILEEQMRKAAELAVTLEVDLHVGNNWYEAK